MVQNIEDIIIWLKNLSNIELVTVREKLLPHLHRNAIPVLRNGRLIFTTTLLPTNEQKEKIDENFQIYRKIYNYALDRSNEHYATTKTNLSLSDILSEITKLRQNDACGEFQNVSSEVMRLAAYRQNKDYFCSLSKKHKIPSYKDIANEFSTCTAKISFLAIRLPKIGKVKLGENIPLETDDHLVSARIYKNSVDDEYYVDIVINRR